MTTAVHGPIQYSVRRAGEVWWTAVLMLGFWVALITVGPYVESRWAPVIDNFHIVDVDMSEADIVKFRPAFDKHRQCTYLGVQWFVEDDRKQISRHNIVTSDKVRAPMTYPVGTILGDWWEVGTRDSDREMYGVMHHQCGMPWESRSLVGPFSVVKTQAGKVSLTPTRLARR